MTKTTINTTETAKLIRGMLKRTYPAQKFSVRSKSYAGGSSVNVHWSGGPERIEVERLLAGFEGRGFDGMNDSTYYRLSWLTSEGDVVLAGGSTDGMGGRVDDPPPPGPGSRLVQFYSFVFCNRHEAA